MTIISRTVAELVTPAVVATSARVDADDAALMAELPRLIAAARAQAEHITGRVYRRGVERVTLTGWPAASQVIPAPGPADVAVSYWDGADWITLTDDQAPQWVITDDGLGVRIAPAAGQSWPTLQDDALGRAVRVDVTVGPAVIDDVPACVVQYICASVAAWIDQPGAMAGRALDAHPLFARLLDAEWIAHA
ncbi:MAG: hypothetical protein RIQ53_4167 [Pseudomonadota bacterium]|jgi:hypothetical protein